MKYFKYYAICVMAFVSIGTFIACDSDKEKNDYGVKDDTILGTWYGEIDGDDCELTFNGNGKATLLDNDDDVVFKYSYTKKNDDYILRISERPKGYSDDWDQLRVEYINQSKILVYSDFGDGDDRLYGTMTRSGLQGQQVRETFIGAWMMEEETENWYWVCYQVINADGTGIYQEFDFDKEDGRVSEDEYSKFTWTLSNDKKSLYVTYNGGGRETWDVSNVTSTTWYQDNDDDIAYKVADYTTSPSIIGSWRCDYSGQSSTYDLLTFSSKNGTYQNYRNGRQTDSGSFKYSYIGRTLTQDFGTSTMNWQVLLLTCNRMVLQNSYQFGVFRKQ